MAQKEVNRYAEMVLACSEDHYFKGEKVLDDHALIRIVSGELKVIQADRTFIFGAGEDLLFPRNQLSTLVKYSKDGKPYKSLVINLPNAVLREYYKKNTYELMRPQTHEILRLDKSPLLDSFFASVLPYFELNSVLSEKLVAMKTEEALEILRTSNKNIDSMLSDFSEPGKINLADFMEKNYMFNISIDKFSNLTGRSLTTFKRDFKKTFQTSPQRWLTKKRLELAYYELSEKRKKPTEVYYETGFENFSHFSYAFKKHFGYAPNRVQQNH